ncbi:DUF4062 domain-containing protein [Sanguibacter sp. 25GB23B1]|uniref:DUF4062 domain-containing protein n=1 Tax=unclassified Sanguibacter TaxID=2645534 RepID=UPI0032AEC098
MAEERYQVFVSSTYTDLVEERQAVISALLQLGAMPAGMELFPAADDEAWTLIQRVIDESDYYLLIVGGRYGSVTEEGVSFTEKEYDYAQDTGKPVMAFLHGAPDTIPVGKSDLDSTARSRLELFAAKVKRAKHVKYWTSAEDLAGKIALSFAIFTKSYPAIGWVRGDAGDSPETLRMLSAAQAKAAELEAQLARQAVAPPAGVAGLADHDETFDLAFRVQARISNLTAQANVASYQTYEVDVSITWNDLLAELGTSMLNEAPQAALLKRFRAAVNTLCHDEMVEQVRKWLTRQLKPAEIEGSVGKKKGIIGVQIDSATPSESDFEVVLVQLDALGLITQSVKKRAVADRNTYWTLTPWGRTRLTRLRAVRAGRTRPSYEEPEDGLEGALAAAKTSSEPSA